MKKALRYGGYLFLVYLLVGFILLPFIVKPKLIDGVGEYLDANLSIGSLSVNPLSFSVTLDDVLLSQGDTPAVKVGSLYVNVDPSALLYGVIKIARVKLLKPELYLIYTKNKKLNLLTLLKPTPKTQQPKESNAPMPHLVIGALAIQDAKIHYSDYSKPTPFVFTVNRLDFTLHNIDTNDFNKSDGTSGLYANLGDGAYLKVQNSIDGMKPLMLHGTVEFQANKLYTEWRYIRDMVRFEIADGKVSFQADYALNLDDLKHLKISNIEIALNNLRIKPKQKHYDMLRVHQLALHNGVVLPMQSSVHIGTVTLDELFVDARRHSDGSLNFSRYLTSNGKPNSPSKKSKENAKSTPWNIAIDTIRLQKIHGSFDDATVVPHVVSKVNRLDVTVNRFVLNSAKPFDYGVYVSLNDTAACDMNGSVWQQPLKLKSTVACKNFDLTYYNPYIVQATQQQFKKFDLHLSSLGVDAKTQLQLWQEHNSTKLTTSQGEVVLHHLKLEKKSTHKKLIGFHKLGISGIAFDLSHQDLFVQNILLDKLGVFVKKDKNQKLNVADLVVAKSMKKAKKTQHSNTRFHAHVKHLALQNGEVGFQDYSLDEKAKMKLSAINVEVQDVDTQKNSWFSYKVFMSVNHKGRISAKGKVRHTPLKQYGTLDIKNLALMDINPYIHQASYVTVEDGRISLHVKEHYQPSKKKADVVVQGRFGIDSLFVNNTLKNSLLFSLNKFRMKRFTLELLPNRFFAEEALLDSFFVDAVVDANKTINFAQLVKHDNVKKQTDDPAAQPTKPLNAKIVKLVVKNGSAKFADYSIPIPFQTDIHDLNGVVYVLSTMPGETTYVDIDGEVDKYGSTKLQGSLDSSNPKLYTDLDFNFKNLALHSLSGYSASFAGYKINSGKLYLDLGYDIRNSQLQGSNSVIINKIVLGDEVEDENVTHLPLGFVIGLLEDNDGVIDLNLPVEGNLDEPDFKYGTLVWKTLGNLITKAVTAPFAVLGAAMGLDGDELSYIEFEPGRTVITPPQREKLDNIAKMMTKRPKISLEVPAVYAKELDIFALKRAVLIKKVIEKSGEQNIRGENALTIDMLEDIYEDIQDDDVLDTLRKKLHAKYPNEADYKAAYKTKLLHLVIAAQPLAADALEKLAKKRQSIIISYLKNEKHIAKKRLIMGSLKESESDEEDRVVKNNLDIKVE